MSASGFSSATMIAKRPAMQNSPGLTNGRLLLAADAAGFDVLVTVDQGIPHQQNVGERRIALIVLRVPTNRVGDLIQLVPAIVSALDSIAPGQVVMLP
jgi:hypothetical protein